MPFEDGFEPAAPAESLSVEDLDQLRVALGSLTPLELRVVQRHHGLGGGHRPLVYRDVGKRLGLTKFQVVRVHQAAVAKLREALAPAVV